MTSKIINIIGREKYEKFLYKCLSPMPYRKYRRREEYLRGSIPGGFCKKILEWEGEIVGQIEYAPCRYSGLPIEGEGIFVMNCIWVLRKAKGHNLGKLLLEDAISSIKKENAEGFATIALENHPSPWLKVKQLEKLGFRAVDSVSMKIMHKEKYRGRIFKIYLMWIPLKRDAKLPRWDKEKLLEGVTFCLAHPLYHPEGIKSRKIFEMS
jgi:GNAT superfamily N-acetyltransferase